MDWVWANRADLVGLTLTHAWLSAIPVVVGLAIAVPVGWWASRHRRVGSVVLGVGSAVYTIPSLALFVILPSVLGTPLLSPVNVVVALTLYAVALLIRTAVDAFAAVPAVVLDAATATGYSAAGRGWRVELPLAGPVLLAGTRVASFSTVSLVSVGALMGVSSLGSLFTDGFRRNFTTEIVAGVVGTVLLAVVFDAILVMLGRRLMPWAAEAKT
ncbi:MAG TPA: ABC transporter permease [Aeromicrobium sp.]|nr:ABC transporter permease [Aeromicrobium sp.]HKY57497.1 ABC transporter permease [Aeromicrobium sp.]